jgi:CO dehydrogenase nickel-insertion accessory protein CooC1
MAKEGGKNVYFILNKVEDALANKIAAKVDKEQIIGALPFSAVAQEKGLNGEVLDIDLPQIAEITNFLIQSSKTGAS